VNHTIFDRALPAARKIARLKANAVIGQCGLTADDRDDVEAQLLLALCARLRKFDAERSSLRTFTCRVMDREVASLLRYRLAQRRLPLSQSEPVDEGRATYPAPGTSLSTAERLEFWLDVGKVIETLPVPLRKTVLALRGGSPTEAGQNLGTARSVVYERIAQIRQAFLAAGVGPTYFTGGGGR